MKSTAAADAKFSAFEAKFLAEYLERNPTRATEAGEHKYDARWPDVSAEGDVAEKRWLEGMLKELESTKAEDLGVQNRVDRGIIENRLRYWLFSLDELREGDWNPMAYTGLVGDGLDPLVSREFAPIEARMANLKARLEGVPKIVEAAKKRLKKSPKIYTETAIQQNAGLVGLCEKDLAESFAKVPAQKAALEAAAKTAAAALKDFQTFLKDDLLPRSDGDFRLGRARFEKKLRYELDDEVDIDAIAKGARALLAKTFDEMVDTSKELWPKLMKGQALPASGPAGMAYDPTTSRLFVAEGAVNKLTAFAVDPAGGLTRAGSATNRRSVPES